MNDLYLKRWQATSLAASLKAWDETKYRRHPKGSKRGGQFAPKPNRFSEGHPMDRLKHADTLGGWLANLLPLMVDTWGDLLSDPLPVPHRFYVDTSEAPKGQSLPIWGKRNAQVWRALHRHRQAIRDAFDQLDPEQQRETAEAFADFYRYNTVTEPLAAWLHQAAPGFWTGIAGFERYHPRHAGQPAKAWRGRFDESKIRRHPRGTKRGGQFAPKFGESSPLLRPTGTGARVWEMGRREFEAAARRGQLHRATGQWSDDERAYLAHSAPTPLGLGLAAGYSDDDIAHFYANRRGAFPERLHGKQRTYVEQRIAEGYDPFAAAQEELIADALAEGYSVPDGQVQKWPRLSAWVRQAPPRDGTRTLEERLGGQVKDWDEFWLAAEEILSDAEMEVLDSAFTETGKRTRRSLAEIRKQMDPPPPMDVLSRIVSKLQTTSARARWDLAWDAERNVETGRPMPNDPYYEDEINIYASEAEGPPVNPMRPRPRTGTGIQNDTQESRSRRVQERFVEEIAALADQIYAKGKQDPSDDQLPALRRRLARAIARRDAARANDPRETVRWAYRQPVWDRPLSGFLETARAGNLKWVDRHPLAYFRGPARTPLGAMAEIANLDQATVALAYLWAQLPADDQRRKYGSAWKVRFSEDEVKAAHEALARDAMAEGYPVSPELLVRYPGIEQLRPDQRKPVPSAYYNYAPRQAPPPDGTRTLEDRLGGQVKDWDEFWQTAEEILSDAELEVLTAAYTETGKRTRRSIKRIEADLGVKLSGSSLSNALKKLRHPSARAQWDWAWDAERSAETGRPMPDEPLYEEEDSLGWGNPEEDYLAMVDAALPKPTPRPAPVSESLTHYAEWHKKLLRAEIEGLTKVIKRREQLNPEDPDLPLLRRELEALQTQWQQKYEPKWFTSRQAAPLIHENRFPAAGYAASASRKGNYDPEGAEAMRHQDPTLVDWYERGQNLYDRQLRNAWKARVGSEVLRSWVKDPSELSMDVLSIWAYGVDRLFPGFDNWYNAHYGGGYAEADPFEQQEAVRAFLQERGDYPYVEYNRNPDPTKKSYFYASELIASWAHSANDRDMRSLGKQMAAAAEFGQALSSWQQERIDEILARRRAALAEQDQYGTPIPDSTRYLLELPKVLDGRMYYDDETAARAFGDMCSVLRDIYNRTQEYLKSYDRPTIRMYRGVRQFPGDTAPQVGEVVDVTQNAIEAWAAKYSPAEDRASHAFGRETYGSTGGFVVAMDVPKERILALPYTAQGSLPEYEMLIFGGIPERDEAVVVYVSEY